MSLILSYVDEAKARSAPSLRYARDHYSGRAHDGASGGPTRTGQTLVHDRGLPYEHRNGQQSLQQQDCAENQRIPFEVSVEDGGAEREGAEGDEPKGARKGSPAPAIATDRAMHDEHRERALSNHEHSDPEPGAVEGMRRVQHQ